MDAQPLARLARATPLSRPMTTRRHSRADLGSAVAPPSESPLDEPPTFELVELSLDNSRSNFSTFYETERQRIAHALALTLGDQELAVDAANEAMTRAYSRWDEVSTYDSPGGWVYRVGLNWARSWLRRRRRERDRPIRFTEPIATMEPRDKSLDAAIGQLSIEHRAVIICRFYLDWSVQQTADALEIATGTVKSRQSRALEQLRRSIPREEI